LGFDLGAALVAALVVVAAPFFVAPFFSDVPAVVLPDGAEDRFDVLDGAEAFAGGRCDVPVEAALLAEGAALLPDAPLVDGPADAGVALDAGGAAAVTPVAAHSRAHASAQANEVLRLIGARSYPCGRRWGHGSAHEQPNCSQAGLLPANSTIIRLPR
jgi:hypothetical protein